MRTAKNESAFVHLLRVACLGIFLWGCGQPQHDNYLTDVILHVLSLRSGISRANPDFETLMVDAQHIEASARELRSSYPDDPGRGLVMKLQLHAYELSVAVAARDTTAMREVLETIEDVANELQAL